MFVRIWHGRTASALANEYQQFLRGRAIPDYRSVAGNLGAFVLRRDAPDGAHFLTVSLWESMDAIRAFAGDPLERAKYYDEDHHYLLEFEPAVVHYEMLAGAISDLRGILAQSPGVSNVPPHE